jgi:hypothetical protein
MVRSLEPNQSSPFENVASLAIGRRGETGHAKADA